MIAHTLIDATCAASKGTSVGLTTGSRSCSARYAADFGVVMLQDVFKSVEKLCAEEGIDCAKFMYRDNTAILETLEGGRCDPWRAKRPG